MKNLVDKLIKAYSNGLPGEDAQYKLAPASRSRINSYNLDEIKPRLAAVLLLIYPSIENMPHIVFMKRQEYPGVHSGQISFPGGEYEQTDENLETTAFREAKEELNIDHAKLELLGSLSELYIPTSNFLVTPYLAFAYDKPDFRLDYQEVASIIEMPIKFLQTEKPTKSKIKIGASFRLVPSYQYEGNIIWGATAMILSELNELLKN